MMKRGKSLTILVRVAVILLALSGISAAQTVYVNDAGTGDYPTIQTAVDAVGDGGIVVLEPGVYTGDGNHDVDFGGKSVTVQSSNPQNASVVAATVIDLQGTADDPRYGFIIESAEEVQGILDGLTITNSVTTEPASSGVYCAQSGTVIRNCVICDMHSYATGVGYYEMGSAVEVQSGDVTIEDCILTRNVGSGDPDKQGWPVIMSKNQYTCGGVDVRLGSASLVRCTLSDNYAWLGGAVFSYHPDEGSVSLSECQILHNSGYESGALYCLSGRMELVNCVVADNVSATNGGAIFNSGEIFAVNCTLADNDAVDVGDALYCSEEGIADLWNCILWDADDEIVDVNNGQTTVAYSCVKGGWKGNGNISADPCFYDTAEGDYRLTLHSVCIDAASDIASSETDILGNERYDSAFVTNTGVGLVTYVDMGAYEFEIPMVHRFWSSILNRYFYTASESEKDYIVTNYPDAWTYQGRAFFAYDGPADANACPVYRFWSPVLCGHFYTISEEEKDSVIANYPGIWDYEGPAFYAYPVGSQIEGTSPVYRFWSPVLGTHFYTSNSATKDQYIAEESDTWTYEGIAWYAWNLVSWPTTL